MEAYLHLSNGMKLKGQRIGATGKASGEIVFTTGMVGYTQTLTDPSFTDQILVFTYPLMGNYGVPGNRIEESNQLNSGFESPNVCTAGVVVSEASAKSFHWNGTKTLDHWLTENGIPGISGIDTRQLTQVIRNTPNLTAKIGEFNLEQEPVDLEDDLPVISKVSTSERRLIGKGSRRIGLIDCGVKWNIVRQLLSLDCEIELLPWTTLLTEVDCSGWLISNGPGDPQETGNLIPRIQGLLSQERPVFGICLGYQLLALAAGAKTEKLKFGHRGHNHSVQLIGTQNGFMTSQNHGYIVIEESLPSDWKPWFRHLNDGTLEGIRHETKPFHGVQFHPEAAAGPQDTAWILKEFIQRIK